MVAAPPSGGAFLSLEVDLDEGQGCALPSLPWHALPAADLGTVPRAVAPPTADLGVIAHGGGSLAADQGGGSLDGGSGHQSTWWRIRPVAPLAADSGDEATDPTTNGGEVADPATSSGEGAAHQ